MTLTRVNNGIAQPPHTTQRQSCRSNEVVFEERTVDERIEKEGDEELDMSGIKVLANDDSTILEQAEPQPRVFRKRREM